MVININSSDKTEKAVEGAVEVSKIQKCSCCHKLFPLDPDHFYRDKYRPNGFSNTCKLCSSAYVKKKSAQDRADAKKFRLLTAAKSIDPNLGAEDGLKKYSDEELANELKARGYVGELYHEKRLVI